MTLEDESNLKLVIQEFYGITPTKVEKLDIKSTNNVFKIESKQGNFLLKENFKFHKQQIDHLLYRVDVANHLIKKGIRTPRHIKNKLGSVLTEYKDKRYTLLNFIEGKTLHKDVDIDTMVKILANFHNATKDFKSKHNARTKPVHSNEDHETITQLIFKTRKEDTSLLDFIRTIDETEFIKRLKGDLEFIYLCMIKALFSVKNIKFTEETILHYDFKHDNLLLDKNGNVSVLDFDFSHRGYIEADLVKAAKYYAMNEEETELNIETFKRFIESYNNQKQIMASMKDLNGLLIYIILKRLIYAANYTIRGRVDLEFLYDKDIKLLRYLENNKFNN